MKSFVYRKKYYYFFRRKVFFFELTIFKKECNKKFVFLAFFTILTSPRAKKELTNERNVKKNVKYPVEENFFFLTLFFDFGLNYFPG